MNVDSEVKEIIGRVFVCYVKKCLQRSKKDYVQKQNRDLYRLTFLSDLTLNNNIIASNDQSYPTEDYILLLQAGSKLKLSPEEKKILIMKFIDDKTDKEIAKALGVTRQAVSKSKSQLLIKLRKYLEE